MTEDFMKQAGETSTQYQFTNEELKNAIVGMRLTLAFLKGKGFSWELASRPLARELRQLEDFMEARKR